MGSSALLVSLLALSLLCAADAGPTRFTNKVPFGGGYMGPMYVTVPGVKALITFNVTSAPKSKIRYVAEVWGKVQHPQEGPFNPNTSHAKISLWNGAEGQWGHVILSKLYGKWGTRATNGHKIFRGQSKLPTGITTGIIAAPQNYFLLLSWSPFYPVDWFYALRTQLGTGPQTATKSRPRR